MYSSELFENVFISKIIRSWRQCDRQTACERLNKKIAEGIPRAKAEGQVIDEMQREFTVDWKRKAKLQGWRLMEDLTESQRQAILSATYMPKLKLAAKKIKPQAPALNVPEPKSKPQRHKWVKLNYGFKPY